MFLKHVPTDSLIEVLSLQALWNPLMPAVIGQSHCGEEMQDPESYAKAELVFPSGELLPQCWFDPHYRDTACRLTSTKLIAAP